jgi:hypothetical protein
MALFGELSLEGYMDRLQGGLYNEWRTVNQVESQCKSKTEKLFLLCCEES